MNNHFSPQTLDFQVSNNDISSYSDENIIQFIVDHNNNEDKNLGYTQLYQKYLPKALNYYKVHEINEEDAKDHAQQLFINIIDNIGKFKLDAKFNSRFYWMMRNELVDSKRKETKNNNRMKDYFHTQKNKSYHENGFLTSQKEEELNYSEQIQQSIFDSLVPLEKQLLSLRFKDNLRSKQIEKILSISESTVKYKAKKTIQRAQETYNNLIQDH